MTDPAPPPAAEAGRLPEEIVIAVQNFEIWAKAWGDAQGDPPTEANLMAARDALNAAILSRLSAAEAEIERLRSDAREWHAEYKHTRREKNAALARAERMEKALEDLLHACDCEIRDQTNNRTASDKRSAAYAEGALRVAKGIAHRIQALASPAPTEER